MWLNGVIVVEKMMQVSNMKGLGMLDAMVSNVLLVKELVRFGQIFS